MLGPRLLPRTTPEHAPPDLGEHAETLEAHYELTDGFYRLRVRTRSPLIGRPGRTSTSTGRTRACALIAVEDRAGCVRSSARSTTTTSSW